MEPIAQNQQRGSVKHHRIAIILVLTSLAILVSISWACGLFARMPSDSALQRNFYAHQAELGKLVEMSNHDSHVSLIRSDFTYLDTDMSWPRKDVGFSEGRWDEYRQIFHKLNIQGVTRRGEYPASVFVNVYARGGVLGTSEKGYAYSEKPLLPVAISLDVFPREIYNRNRGHAIVFKPLTTNWYIFREES